MAFLLLIKIISFPLNGRSLSLSLFCVCGKEVGMALRYFLKLLFVTFFIYFALKSETLSKCIKLGILLKSIS
jgi:hypothetical protein